MVLFALGVSAATAATEHISPATLAPSMAPAMRDVSFVMSFLIKKAVPERGLDAPRSHPSPLKYRGGLHHCRNNLRCGCHCAGCRGTAPASRWRTFADRGW